MSQPPEGSASLNEWAELLRSNWEARSRSSSRDLFVASHPGWRDAAEWERRAQDELAHFLTGIEPADLAGFDVLEIGCGSGRLAQLLAPRVASYTGFDIAAGMVEAARARCRDVAGPRFFHGDGLGVPAEARDRAYHLAFAAAVFIHCPREVIAANLEGAWQVLAPGGELRFQVLADPEDTTGVVTQHASEVMAEEVSSMVEELTEEEVRLTHDVYYMGHRFRYDELAPLVAAHAPGALDLYRGDLFAIYARVAKPAG